jgi:hypothetical protein
MDQALNDPSVLLFGLFALGSIASLLKTVLSWAGILHLVCALGVIALLWWEERRWSKDSMEQYAPPDTISPLIRPVSVSSLLPVQQKEENLLLSCDGSLDTDTLRSIESRAATLTERISAVYPLVAREDIHKIVWMVIVEMCHEQAQAENARSGRPLPEKTAQTA